MKNQPVAGLQSEWPPLPEKLASLERDLSSQKGDFNLFALVLREDSPDKWDLLVSAPWLEATRKEDLQYLGEQVRSRLDPSEFLSLSRIVVLNKDNPVREAIHRVLRGKHCRAEFRNCQFHGLQVEHAYIITSERENSA